MIALPSTEQLRQHVRGLEQAQRRFGHIISVADAVDPWLPHRGLSTGCIHEIKAASIASAIAFSAVLSSRLDPRDILYISPDRSLYPLGLLPYGVKLDRLFHISPRRSQDLAWAVMEALRCPQVSAVIAFISGLDLTQSRRLQLAAEASGATGFLLGDSASAPIASPITRWKISPDSKPRQRFDQPVWALELLYCRGGRPGKWVLEWTGQDLTSIDSQPVKQIIEEARERAREALAG